jgi:molybdenum cofactor cytidylyltransferase
VIVTGVVLAAGSSRRLGRPKQLLAFRGTTLLDATLDIARRCEFDQLIVTVGGAGDEVRATVDLSNVDVVDNPEFDAGCGSSISAAIAAIDDRSAGLVLMLGDQPGVSPDTIRRLVNEAGTSPLAVCRYTDALGHPFWFARSVFDDLRALHGDKAVWKLLESGRHQVVEVTIGGPVPIDVDTWDDYEALLARDAADTAIEVSP